MRWVPFLCGVEDPLTTAQVRYLVCACLLSCNGCPTGALYRVRCPRPRRRTAPHARTRRPKKPRRVRGRSADAAYRSRRPERQEDDLIAEVGCVCSRRRAAPSAGLTPNARAQALRHGAGPGRATHSIVSDESDDEVGGGLVSPRTYRALDEYGHPTLFRMELLAKKARRPCSCPRVCACTCTRTYRPAFSCCPPAHPRLRLTSARAARVAARRAAAVSPSGRVPPPSGAQDEELAQGTHGALPTVPSTLPPIARCARSAPRSFPAAPPRPRLTPPHPTQVVRAPSADVAPTDPSPPWALRSAVDSMSEKLMRGCAARGLQSAPAHTRVTRPRPASARSGCA
jgi:hypothetical protein